MKSSPKIILIGHKARQGKDTFAGFLRDELVDAHNKNAVILSFADPMKNIVAEALGVSRETLDSMKNDSDYYRSILQRFGSGLMKHHFNNDVWKKLTMQRIESLMETGIEYFIIPDFRFDEEYIAGATTINIRRDSIKQNKDAHISEIAMDDYIYDYTIHNNGSLNCLISEASRMCHRVMEQ